MKFKILTILMIALPLAVSSPSTADETRAQKQILDARTQVSETQFDANIKTAAQFNSGVQNSVVLGAGRGGNTTGYIEVSAKFIPAAYVKFRHEAFFLPDFDQVLLRAQSFFKNTEVTIEGLPGDTAVLSCEVQYMEGGKVKTYNPVQRRACNAETLQGQVEAKMGETLENQVALKDDRSDMGQYDSYVALEITYI